MNTVEDFKRNFYKDGTTRVHIGKVVSSIILIIVFIAFVIYNNSRLDQNDKERLENRRYTIGVTGKQYHNIKSSKPTIKFYYRVVGKLYEGNQDIDVNYEKFVRANGGRYFVEFSSKDPKNSKLLLDKEVPVNVQSFPNSGWSEIPGK